MLGVTDVAGYLLKQELLAPSAVVHGGLRVEDASRLNHVFVVTLRRGRGYVVKVAGQVPREAAVLDRLRSLDRRLARSLPDLVAHDPVEGVLVLGAAPSARNLGDHHRRGRFSQALARETGRALALLHALPAAALDGLPRAADPTWHVRLHQLDLNTLRTLSPAAIELTRTIQGLAPLCTELDALAEGWTEDSLIHADVRWDNCLAVPSAASHRWSRLQLIDWELCCAGDPAFDVGAFIGEYLRAWMQSIPIADPRDPGGLLSHARLPLQRMRPSLRAFWDGYTRHHGRATLGRAMRFAAVRLLAAALEEAQTQAELRASTLALLPLSRQIMQRPRDAADLCGLGAWWVDA
jgi:aminoglycoside phosphotransferase (APT) family kinase protein